MSSPTLSQSDSSSCESSQQDSSAIHSQNESPSGPNFFSFESAQHESFTTNYQNESLKTKCSVCLETFIVPKVLPCLHTFCQACLEKLSVNLGKILCPVCKQECTLPPEGISGLLSDYAVNNCLGNLGEENLSPPCTGCKTKDAHAVSECYDCKNYLCGNCVTAHQYMHCFKGHKVVSLKEEIKNDFKIDKLLCCMQHCNETLIYFCLTCNVPVCKECMNAYHPKESHIVDEILNVGPKQIEILKELHKESKAKVEDLIKVTHLLDEQASHLQRQTVNSKAEIDSTFNFYISLLKERKQELLRELEEKFNVKMNVVNLLNIRIQEMIGKLQQLTIFVERIMKFSSNAEILMFRQLLNDKLQTAIKHCPDINLQLTGFEFVSNYPAIRASVKNTFGYIRHSDAQSNQIQPIARPQIYLNSEQADQNGHIFEPNTIPKQNVLENSFRQFLPPLDLSQYEKWSNGLSDTVYNGTMDVFHPLIESTLNISPGNKMYTLKSDVKRIKMVYHCKFGEVGTFDGQFSEPSGVAVNAQNDIIVADANNCRIQVFDKEGRFKFQFGKNGTDEGQMLYPNRVGVVKVSGDIVVSERSPVHQIQIYNQYGQFVRRFGANVLQHPRGITVDNKGRIIIIECKIMRIMIFDQIGNVLYKFSCAKYLQFPNGVVTNDKQEIFISDNRAHCVKVFSYDGIYLRTIGREGLTNFPIGVCINERGEILVADNHNNFNITVFTQEGQLIGAFESKIKHEQCFDVALMDGDNVVLTGKNCFIYIYCCTPYPVLL